MNSSEFGTLPPLSPDPLLGLIGRVRADPRSYKMDLGVGVYRNESGQTPVFAAVKQAERQLIESQASKCYLGSEGDPEFLSRLGAVAFGAGDAVGLQTVGGTGALRLAGDLLARAQPGRRIWMGVPTWSNHASLLAAAGLRTKPVDLFDPASGTFRPEALLDALHAAQPGDAVLLQGCCHNPTGVDPGSRYWERAAELIVSRRLVPLLDVAYQGLGSGWDQDGDAMRILAQRVPHLLIAYSCDKNFGLYRERVGALFIAGTRPREAVLLRDHLLALARSNYSMPPDHGAAVVRLILRDAPLRNLWLAELDAMRNRLKRLRLALAAQGRIGGVDLAALASGQGMFATLALNAAEIDRLQAEFGIYLAPSGRINIAGLTEAAIADFAGALAAVQRKTAA